MDFNKFLKFLNIINIPIYKQCELYSPRRNWLQQVEEDNGLSVGAAQIAGKDCSMWRTLWPSAGQAQQWVSEWVSVCVCLSARWLNNYCRYLLSVWKKSHVTVKGQGQPHLSVGSRSLVRLWAILSLTVRVYLRRLYFLHFMFCFLNCRRTPITSIVLLAETKNSSHRVANLRQLTSIEFNVLIRLIKTSYLLYIEEQTVPSIRWSWSPLMPNDSWVTARQNVRTVTYRCYFLKTKSFQNKRHLCSGTTLAFSLPWVSYNYFPVR